MPIFDHDGHCNNERLKIEVAIARRIGASKMEIIDAVEDAWEWSDAAKLEARIRTL